MRNDAQLPATSELSYLDASKVSSPAGALSELDVLSAEGRRLVAIFERWQRDMADYSQRAFRKALKR